MSFPHSLFKKERDKEYPIPSGDELEIENYEVEDFVNDGKHYSHHHPLRLMSKSEQDDDDKEVVDKQWCMICGLPILSCPSFTCTLGCKFFLHQPCALQFPTKLIHPTHASSLKGSHILFIRRSSPSFIYKCKDCDFSLHPLVALPHVEIKTEHKSHAWHPLVASHKKISCECDACGREHKQSSFFFHCGDCNFWIHPDCAVVPSILRFSGHPYPFIVAYSLPSYLVDGTCIICRQEFVKMQTGVYFSPQYTFWAHVGCGSTCESASQTRLYSIQLPDDDWETIFPSSVIRRYYADTITSVADVEYDYRLTINRYHNHGLILIDDDDDNIISSATSGTRYMEYSLSCDLCTRTINNISFYKCGRDSCHFSAHKVCADVLPMLFGLIAPLPHQSIIFGYCSDTTEFFFNSVFYCAFCRRPCNGICYYWQDVGDSQRMCIDLECVAAPSTVNHVSHSQHLLFRTTRMSSVATPLTCCPSDTFIHDVYRCILCDYYIHISCAMLPKTINICHQYDDHPLRLFFHCNNIVEDSSRSFCEVCEKDIDLNYWSYGCGECDKWFHINCISSVGYLSKVKFGGTISLPNAHVHPLALTRMINLPNQRCGCCEQIIHGLLDDMAFFCELCHFWLHFSCARDATAATKTLRLYSEEVDHINDQFIRRVREIFY